MRRLLLLSTAALLLGACGGRPMGGPDVDLRIAVAEDVVAPGVPFEVVVERTWPEGTQPAPFEAKDLAPLVVQAPGVARDESQGRVRDTRGYTAQVQALDYVRIPAATHRVLGPDGVVLRSVRSDVTDVRVATRLEAGDVDVEPPPEPLAERPVDVPWALLAGLAGLLAALGVVALRRRGRPSMGNEPFDAPRDAPAGPMWSARVAALGPVDAGDAVARARQVMLAADLLREAVGTARGVDARSFAASRLLRAIEEHVAGVATAEGTAPAVAGARDLLRLADRVKYGAHVPSREATQAGLDATSRVVGLLHPEAT